MLSATQNALLVLLDAAVRATGCPLFGIQVLDSSQALSASNVTIDYDPAATQTQKNTAASVVSGFDYTTATAVTRQLRTAADAFITNADAPWKLIRAVLLVAMNEINTLRERLAAQDSAVSQATSLANLQSRWATVATNSPMADRTFAQLKTAVQNQIDGGSAD